MSVRKDVKRIMVSVAPDTLKIIDIICEYCGVTYSQYLDIVTHYIDERFMNFAYHDWEKIKDKYKGHLY